MFRYNLRTLLIVLALGPPVLAAGYWLVQAFRAQDDDLDAYRHPVSGIVLELYEPETEGPGLVSVPVEEGESVSEDKLLQYLPSP